MKTKEITLYVQVSIPVSLTYDGELPDANQLRQDALCNFLDHPALHTGGIKDLEGYVDSIGNGEMEV